MSVSGVTLPNEFYDRTSAMMLRQPEPQYLYAQLVYLADLNAEFRRVGDMGLTAERSMPDVGPAAMQFQLMQSIIAGQMPYAEAIVVSDELAPGKPGHTIRMNRPVFSGGGYTAAARTIAASQTISVVPVDLTQEQVSITIARRAGPYDAVNSRVAPRAVDRLDAERGVHSIASIVGIDLYRDRLKFVDSVYGSLFDAGSTIIFPGDPNGALTTDAGAFPTGTVAGQRSMDFQALLQMQEKLTLNNVQRFANGQFIAILSPRQVRQLQTDPDFVRQAPFTPALNPINPLSQSLVRSIAGIDVYMSNTQTIDASTVGAACPIDHGAMFGPGALGRVSSGPCRAAASADDNYGETAKVIWIAYEGEAMLDNRFVVNVHSC